MRDGTKPKCLKHFNCTSEHWQAIYLSLTVNIRSHISYEYNVNFNY